MTSTEQILLTLLGLIVYFIIGIGSCKIQRAGKISGRSVLDVVIWPVDLMFAAFLL
jgi:hypothetical protein